MSELRISADIGTEGTGRSVDGGSEEYEATGAFAAEGPMLLGAPTCGGKLRSECRTYVDGPIGCALGPQPL